MIGRISFHANVQDPVERQALGRSHTLDVRCAGLLGNDTVLGHHRLTDAERAVLGKAAAQREWVVHHVDLIAVLKALHCSI